MVIVLTLPACTLFDAPLTAKVTLPPTTGAPDYEAALVEFLSWLDEHFIGQRGTGRCLRFLRAVYIHLTET